LVATHFINKGQIDIDFHIRSKKLDNYLEAAIQRTGKPLVLLIDELNTLSLPIDEACSQELKALFLNKENRMLVFSTHLPMDVDTVLRLY
jgi:type II secretory pathway predicted ATPase ExeA